LAIFGAADQLIFEYSISSALYDAKSGHTYAPLLHINMPKVFKLGSVLTYEAFFANGGLTTGF